MVKCPRCGCENTSKSKYCHECSYPLSMPGPSLKKPEEKKSRWGTAKKILIVLGIIAIALLLFNLIYNASIPDSKDSLNVVSSNKTSYDTSYNPFEVNVQYNGTWDGHCGPADNTQDYSGNGPDSFRLDAASWDNIYIEVEKVDGSSNPLTVQLIRDGKVIAENTTNDTSNKVVITN